MEISGEPFVEPNEDGLTKVILSVQILVDDEDVAENEYTLDILGDDTDLVAALYNEFGLVLSTDDDSGGDQNPRLLISLPAGQYFGYIRVSQIA